MYFWTQVSDTKIVLINQLNISDLRFSIETSKKTLETSVSE